MGKVSGIVQVRNNNGEFGAAISGAVLNFQPHSGGGNRATVTTSSNGRYSVELGSGDYLVSATHPDAGSSSTWRKIVSVPENDNHTFNIFLSDTEERLNNLISSFPGEIGLYALNLQTGDEAAYNEDCYMYLASVSKIAIAAACVDLMTDASDINKTVKLELRHYREEGKALRYEDLGRNLTLESLFNLMIRRSDTTATDFLCEYFGISNINDRLSRLNIPGLRTLSSMIQLDRRRAWITNPEFGFLPDFAFSIYRRHKITTLLRELDAQVPHRPAGSEVWVGDDDDEMSSDKWEAYLSEHKDQATPKGFGTLLKKIANQTLLDKAWKNDLLLNTVMTFGTQGRFSGIEDRSQHFDSKGGSHFGVRNEAGILRDDRTKNPLAILVVFTQRREFNQSEMRDRLIKAAGDLALQQIGMDQQLIDRSVNTSSSDAQLLFKEPVHGCIFKQGDRPVIRWESHNIEGNLTLRIQGPEASKTISRNVRDDGEWHSFTIPDDLPSDDMYRFILTGSDANDNEISASSEFFTIGDTIHMLKPSVGESLKPGTNPDLIWLSTGISSKLRIRLLHHGRAIRTITSNARDDGEWHSWTVPDNLPTDMGYQIEISSVDDPNIFDKSAPFAIGGYIEVTVPKPDSILEIGTRPDIKWTSRDTVGPLQIELIGKNGNPEDVISTRARDDGEWHSWTVPDVEDGTGYRIRISDKGADAIIGMSDLFQIGTRYEWLSPSVEQAGSASSPRARPHFFPFGQTADLRWRRIGPDVGQLRIELLKGGNVIDRFTNNANDDGEWHSWTPGADLEPASDYQMRITGVNRPEATGLSAQFSLGAMVDANLNMHTLRPGSNPQLTWTSQNVNRGVTFTLTDRHGNTVSNSRFSIPRSRGATTLTIRTRERGWHRYKIESNELPGVFGYTDWFRIRG